MRHDFYELTDLQVNNFIFVVEESSMQLIPATNFNTLFVRMEFFNFSIWVSYCRIFCIQHNRPFLIIWNKIIQKVQCWDIVGKHFSQFPYVPDWLYGPVVLYIKNPTIWNPYWKIEELHPDKECGEVGGGGPLHAGLLHHEVEAVHLLVRQNKKNHVAYQSTRNFSCYSKMDMKLFLCTPVTWNILFT